jgi:hypothetical protein
MWQIDSQKPFVLFETASDLTHLTRFVFSSNLPFPKATGYILPCGETMPRIIARSIEHVPGSLPVITGDRCSREANLKCQTTLTAPEAILGII